MRTLVILVAASCCVAELVPSYVAPWFLHSAKPNIVPLAGNSDYLGTSYHHSQHHYSPDPYTQPYNQYLTNPYGFFQNQQVNSTFGFPYSHHVTSPYGFPYGHRLNNPYGYSNNYPFNIPYDYTPDDYLPSPYGYKTDNYLHNSYSYNSDPLNNPYNYAFSNHQLNTLPDFAYGDVNTPLTFPHGHHFPTSYGYPKGYPQPYGGLGNSIFKNSVFPYGHRRVVTKSGNLENTTPATEENNK